MIREADLNQFTGSGCFIRNPLNRKVLHSEGVEFLAKKAEAYWLIDAIASHLGTEEHANAAKCDPRIDYVHFWILQLDENGGAKLFARADSSEEPFIEQGIESTDFPFDQFEIWVGYDGYYWTLYLPSEH